LGAEPAVGYAARMRSRPPRPALAPALAAALLLATAACLGPDPEAVAVCDEFITRLVDHMNGCGFDGDRLRTELDETLPCDNAVRVEGDPLACAAEFEAVACSELNEASVEATLGTCEAEIFVLRPEE
jgi:hypothetical protein